MTRITVVSDLAIVLAVMLVAPLNAAVIPTGANCSLADAIESANSNAAVGGCSAGAAGRDTVVVTANVVLSTVNNGANGLPVVTEDLVIRSPAAHVTTLVTRDFALGTPEFRILEVGSDAAAPSVTILRLHLNNGRVTGSFAPGDVPIAGAGGCIYLRNGTLNVVDSVLQECVAFGAASAQGLPTGAKGGAIYAAGGTLRVRDSNLSANEVIGGEAPASGFPGGSAEGAAISATGSVTSFIVEDTIFSSNFATGGAGVSSGGVAKGGAIALYGGSGSSGSIARSTFSANAASGGAASDGNSAQSLGGGIAVEGAILTVTDSDLTNNVVTSKDSPLGQGGQTYGGALYASASTLAIGESDIVENRATGGQGQSPAFDGTARGGGLYLAETTATIDGVRIDSNSISGASPGGGGIAVFGMDAAVTSSLITHSTLGYNHAIATSGSATGGALYQAGDTVSIRNTTISDNNADVGGGLFQDHGTTFVVRSTFSSNAANTYGGAVAVDSPGFLSHTVELANATISGNSAGVNGGGLYLTGAPLDPDVTTVLFYNSVVTNNSNGGVHLVEDQTAPELVAGNTIIGAQASGADCSVSGSAILSSDGGNLESGTTCGFTAASDQQSVADLGMSAIGNHGGESLTHELLPGSPAIDAGRSRLCNRRANGQDQRGLARFYDGNGDRAFDCDSGAMEFQGLLANPGFEQPLNAANDWSLLASGAGDGRVRSTKAPSGRFIVVLQANGALETLTQTVSVAGGPGETYVLTLLGSGSGLTAGEALDVTLESTSGGMPVDSEGCSSPFPSSDFSGSPAACELTATGAYDSLEVTIGWNGPTTGSIALDAVSLTRR